MIAILVSGLIIAVVGLIQWALWNGKILWTMVPLDWGAPNPAARRASGPFVNPDHFAGYLAMVFPFMLSGVVFGGFPAHSNAGPATRIICGVAAFLIFTAVALSQSRAGWMGLAIGTVALFFFVQSRPRTVDDTGADKVTARPLRTSLALLAAMVVLASMFIGGQGREESARRVGVTVSQGGSDLGDRIAVWSKTPAIVREFPLFGVGLGAWPEVFYRFEPAPRSDLLYNAAHNDYIELLIDLGLVGVALLAWFAVRLAARLRDALRTVPRHLLPALAAMTAGLIAMAAIEFFDFDLQIPANLIAFAILAGLALRMSIPPDPPKDWPRPVRAEAGPWSERIVYLPMAAAFGLAIFAMTQSGLPYPFDIVTPRFCERRAKPAAQLPVQSYGSSYDARALRRRDETCDAIARTRDLGVARSHRSTRTRRLCAGPARTGPARRCDAADQRVGIRRAGSSFPFLSRSANRTIAAR